ncbi:alpha/beta hydrolase [Curtobacterium sp. MCBD17_021]|uniref:alpha/beta hydrolase n=1 Tax=Curtobacterium sp. MCBD17_021 TaxID=2175665 RepID=UPI000DA6E9F6|nr:alpha/beta hydrolase [Curtobacterium sp. MCBD17_021]PZE64559.1 hypothetical protein DEI83_11750 [Curtobacterium sp. MCBD17_021]
MILSARPLLSGVDPGVWNSDYAKTGRAKLADSIRGLNAVRSGDAVTTNVIAHSYGTTTAAYGLTESGVHVNSFVTVASAGIPDSIPTADHLNADSVFSGQAENVNRLTDGTIPFLREGEGDQWAATGRNLSTDHHIDPTWSVFGSHTFGADGASGFNGVTDHGVHTSGGTGYLDKDTESLRNVAHATTGQSDEMTAYHPKGIAALQEDVIDYMESRR